MLSLIRALAAWLKRIWPALIIGLVGIVATGAAELPAYAGASVYWTRTEILFLAPTSAVYPNSLTTTSGDLIVTAGAVARMVTGPAKVMKYADPAANLVGIGVRDGWSLRLPDTGGQWAPNFATQSLDLEVIASDADTVASRRDAIIAEVNAALLNFQVDQGVAPVNFITTTVSPDPSPVERVTGSRPRAVGMTAVLGIGATMALIAVWNWSRTRRLRVGAAATATSPAGVPWHVT